MIDLVFSFSYFIFMDFLYLQYIFFVLLLAKSDYLILDRIKELNRARARVARFSFRAELELETQNSIEFESSIKHRISSRARACHCIGLARLGSITPLPITTWPLLALSPHFACTLTPLHHCPTQEISYPLVLP